MNTSNSIFKFMTIRNASDEVKSDVKFEIQPKTEVTSTLVKILRGNQKQAEKLKSFNQCLNDFIKDKSFYKSKQELQSAIAKIDNAKKDKKDNEETIIFYKNLYDNIVVRAVTNSNKTEAFKLLNDTIKSIFQKLNCETIKSTDTKKLKIVLPEGFIISFTNEKSEKEIVANEISKPNIDLVAKIDDLVKQKDLIQKRKEENVEQINVEQQKISKQQNDIALKNNSPDGVDLKAKKSIINKRLEPSKETSTVAIDKLKAVELELHIEEQEVNNALTIHYKEAINLLPKTKYAYIGERYIDVTNFASVPASKIENDSILVYSNECYLKFPFKIADLRVVEQKTVGYLPAEIAHINNTQSGERHEKVTRRLKRVETFDSLITEDEVTKETDVTSTEKFGIEKAASDVQTEQNSLNVNASVSGTYGVVTASLDAGFSHSESSTNSNTSSQSYAKEIVQKVVDKVSHKVKSERSVKSVEEFEETVTHIIDNTESDEPKSYVYRWLSKIVRATLKNYGKRLIFQFDVAHPSNYYLTRLINEKPALDIPPDPRNLKKSSADSYIRKFYEENPSFPSFSVHNFDQFNYLAWGELYKIKVEAPPISVVVVSVSNDDAKKDIIIPEGYQATKAYIANWVREDIGDNNLDLTLMVGKKIRVSWWQDSNWNGITEYSESIHTLDNERKILPVSFNSYKHNGILLTIEVECTPTLELIKAWQVKCYHTIIDAYENLKTEAENKMSAFNPNNSGLNPSRKSELIRTELKKGVLQKMFRCKSFWINDGYIVNQEYTSDCCNDSKNAEQIRFLETTFDWKNMTYELHPYFYTHHDKDATKDNWSTLLDLTDDDPHFEAFLQSSYATVHIPVHRDSEKEIAAINFIMNGLIANQSILPPSMQHLLDDLEVNTAFEFIDETPTDIPFIEIKKEYDKLGHLKIYYFDASNSNAKVFCTEVTEFDKDGNQTNFYYSALTNDVVISEIKEAVDSEGRKYNYYFNSVNEKIMTHRTKTEFDIQGNATNYYSTDLGIFTIPTDLVILEAGVQNGIKINGYPEDNDPPTSDVLIPKQYSPAIIKKD